MSAKIPKFEFQGLIFWPEHATIHIVDKHTGEYTSATMRQFYDRYNHLRYVLVNGGYDTEPAERLDMERNLENMRKCLKIAASQAEEMGLTDLIPEELYKEF
jgi:hypothetical protein